MAKSIAFIIVMYSQPIPFAELKYYIFKDYIVYEIIPDVNEMKKWESPLDIQHRVVILDVNKNLVHKIHVERGERTVMKFSDYAKGSWEVLGSSSVYERGDTKDVNGYSCIELKRFRTFDVPSEVLSGAQLESIKLLGNIPEISDRVKKEHLRFFSFYHPNEYTSPNSFVIKEYVDGDSEYMLSQIETVFESEVDFERFRGYLSYAPMETK